MQVVPGDQAKGLKTPIWDEYKKVVNDAEKKQVREYSVCVCIKAVCMCVTGNYVDLHTAKGPPENGPDWPSMGMNAPPPSQDYALDWVPSNQQNSCS